MCIRDSAPARGLAAGCALRAAPRAVRAGGSLEANSCYPLTSRARCCRARCVVLLGALGARRCGSRPGRVSER
eukprot:13830701-Alexandrium_andersonii.AAC.1